MNLHLADKVAQAVLYEGYLLYPYRPDTAKNRRRWTFGGLFPPAYCQAHGGDPSQLQTECLVLGSAATALDLRLRCLHLQARLVGQLEQPLERLPKGALPPYRLVETLRLGKETYTAWQEAVEREVVWPGLSLEELLVQPRRMAFSFPAAESVDPLWLPSGAATGVLVRRQPAVQGAVEIRAAGLGGGVFRLTVSASNLTPLEELPAADRC